MVTDMNAPSQHRPLNTGKAALAAVALAAALSPAWGQASKNWQEAPGWYGSVAIGQALSVEDTQTRVNLGGAPVNVSLDGTIRYDKGNVGSLAVGRQGRSAPQRAGEDPVFWRVEGEWWTSRLERERFEAGILSASLNDRVRAQGLFLNGLIRVAATENTQWWIGTGLGRVKVRQPEASAATPGCGCLGGASSSNTAIRLKALAERKVTESSALFLELSYTDIFGTTRTAAGKLPQTSYSHPAVGALAIGWRTRF